MPEVGRLVESVRSKNAGPFFVTVDVFCGSPDSFEIVREQLDARKVADLLQIDPSLVRCFELIDLNVLKFSFPRANPQGSRFDRDMHGAQFAALIEELCLP